MPRWMEIESKQDQEGGNRNNDLGTCPPAAATGLCGANGATHAAEYSAAPSNPCCGEPNDADLLTAHAILWTCTRTDRLIRKQTNDE